MEKWSPPSGWILECSRGNPLTETLIWWGQASEGLPSHARQTALTGGHARGQIYRSREDIAVLESSPPTTIQKAGRRGRGSDRHHPTHRTAVWRGGDAGGIQKKSGMFLNMGSGEFMPL